MITKYIPKSMTRVVSRAALKADANSPKLLFIGGVVGVVGATILACRATLRVEDVLTQHQKTMQDINAVVHSQYDAKDRNHDKQVIFVQTSVTLIRLYAPAIILGSLSVAALTKSHNILQQRNAALSAAYAGLDASFKNYRARVQKELGEEKEKEIWHDAQERDIYDDKGKLIGTVKEIGPQGCSAYAELYSSDTNRNFVVGSDEANAMVLRQRENYLNDRLRMRGHVFLNEVLEELGFEHSTAGSVVGWLFKPEDANHDGQSFITFGCWGDSERISFDPLMRNNGEGIFLDFNVDGEIYKRLDEVKPIWRHADKALRPRRTRNW